MILAIDTSVGISVSIHDGTETVYEFTSNEHGVQGELTAQFIANAISAADITSRNITDVVVGVGPGPFTGLRVGIASALAIAHALDIPVHGYCSLDAVGCFSIGNVLIVSDARRKELYWAQYRDGVRVSGPHVNTPSDIIALATFETAIGPAAQKYSELISGDIQQIQAGKLADLFTQGKGQVHEVVPMYLRKPDAVEPSGRKQVLN